MFENRKSKNYNYQFKNKNYWNDKNIFIQKVYWQNLDYSTSNPDLFEKIPQKIVDFFKKGWLTITKLRQYYQSVVNLYNVFQSRLAEKDKVENVENELKTEFNLLLAKINYDVNRKNSKVPQEVYEFVKFNRDKVLENPKENLKIFKKHFETVVAYSVWKLKN